jgi:putative transposase
MGQTAPVQQLTKTVLETALNQEMTEHLGHDKHAPAATKPGTCGTGLVRRGC